MSEFIRNRDPTAEYITVAEFDPVPVYELPETEEEQDFTYEEFPEETIVELGARSVSNGLTKANKRLGCHLNSFFENVPIIGQDADPVAAKAKRLEYAAYCEQEVTPTPKPTPPNKNNNNNQPAGALSTAEALALTVSTFLFLVQ